MTSLYEPPRLERFGPVVLAGYLRRHRLPREPQELYRDVAAQWRELAEVAHNIPALPPRQGYGVALRMADGGDHFEYFSGFVIPGRARLSLGFDCLEIPAVRCAVFAHREHVSLLRRTIETAIGCALPLAGLDVADETGAPDFIQRYSDSFDPETGLGGLDILIPVKDRQNVLGGDC